MKRNALLSIRQVSWSIGLIVITIVLLITRLLAPNFFWHLISPITHTTDAFTARSRVLMSLFTETEVLMRANQELEDKNATLAAENKVLSQKVANLTTLLGAPAPLKDMPSILGSVVARPPQSPYDTLILAVGKRGGVKLGMEAFAHSSVPIGIVSLVLDDFSRVTLFSAPNIQINGWIGQTSVPVTIRGAGGGAMSAVVARTAPVSVNDTVFFTGPGMLPIGRVIRIDSDPSSPGMTLRIVSAANLFSIGEVVLRATNVASILMATSTVP